MARQKVNPGQVNNYAFNAYLTSNQTFTTNGVDYLLATATELYDYGGVFNNSTYVWTAPATGVFHFDFMLHLNSAANTTLEIRPYKNAAIYSYGVRGDAGGGFPTVEQGIDIPCVAGDTVQFYGNASVAGTTIQGATPIATYISGFMVTRTA